MNKAVKRVLLFIAMILIIAGIFFVIFMSTRDDKADTVKVGIILSGGKDELGWNGTQYDGIAYACEKLGTKLLVREKVSEGTGECEKAVDELIAEGAGMIILGSYGYDAEIAEKAGTDKNVSFYSIASTRASDNITMVFGRMYEARYLCGVAAGMTTKTGHIGYVAAMPNNEVNRGINAFALGVKRGNPDADVTVIWTGDWDDEEKETEAAEKLISEAGADVLMCHQNRDYVVRCAEKHGIYSIGNNEYPPDVSGKCLTAAIWDWRSLFTEIIKEYLQDRDNKREYYWYGLDTGVVGIAELSAAADSSAKEEVERAKSEILNGRNVFSGEIHNQKDEHICGDGEALSDAVLLEQMEWFVKGVKFYE